MLAPIAERLAVEVCRGWVSNTRESHVLTVCATAVASAMLKYNLSRDNIWQSINSVLNIEVECIIIDAKRSLV